MRRFLPILFLSLLLLTSCSGEQEPSVVRTVEETPAERVSTLGDEEETVLRTYSELSDGSWECGGLPYQYRLVLTGRLPNAVRDITYTLLSNTEGITFDQAWRASGLSSSTADYFAPEDAVFVAIQ